eukprot:jgi/Mesen1/5822/ME000296S05104
MLGILRGFLRGRSVPGKGISQLTSKRAGKNFYKGKGARNMGRHTRKGSFLLEEAKMPTYVVPDLTDFKLKAYVSHTVNKKSPPSPTS